MRLLAFALLFSAAPVLAAPRLFLDGTVPPGLRFAREQVTVSFRVTSDRPARVDVTLFVSGGGQVLLAGLQPDGVARSAVLPLPRGVNGQEVSIFGVAQEQGGGPLVPADRTLAVLVDDVGPGAIAVTSPAFPAVSFVSPLIVSGTVPGEKEGTVEARAQALGRVIGAGAILADGRFTVAIDLGLFPAGSTNAIVLQAIDAAGNRGGSFSSQVTVCPPGAPGSVRIEGLQTAPPSGSLTNNPAMRVAGRVVGERPPLRVDFLVDGFLASQLTGLVSGQTFGHTLALPSDGVHTVSVRVMDAAGQKVEAQAGSVTLDRVAPGAPVIVEPAGPVFTREDRVRVRGFLAEAPAAGRFPAVLFRGPSGVRFEPAQPQEVRDARGEFITTVVLAGLPDGSYPISISARDAAGNEQVVQGVTLSLGGGQVVSRTSRVPQLEAVRRARRASAERRGWLARVRGRPE